MKLGGLVHKMGFDKTEVPLTVAEYFGFPSRYHLLHYSILNIVKKSKYKTGHQGASTLDNVAKSLNFLWCLHLERQFILL